MSTSLVLTVTGRDQPGLVDTLSQTVAAHGANWQEGRMSRVAGRFVGLLHVLVPDERVGPLETALGELAGLDVTVARGIDGPQDPSQRYFVLEVVGNDRTGIVRDISHALAALGVNVEDLITETHSAPQHGGLLFKATARLSVPASLAAQVLAQRLEGIANDLMVDLHPDAES